MMRGLPFDWRAHLEQCADGVLAGLDREALERAERERVFSIVMPVLLVQGGRSGSVPEEVRLHALRYPDLALWWALADASFVPEWSVGDGDGPLFEQDAFTAIEVWTETELAALHALSHRKEMRERVQRAVGWHVERTQPDNATNRPWAVHAFVEHGSPEADHFAQTLVSNCIVQSAQPDVLSALILKDAARLLGRR